MTNEQIERIKNLMTEAGKTSLFEFASWEMTLEADGKEYYKIPLEFCEVFAELIVKECLDIMTKEEYNTTLLTCNPMVSGAISDARYYIKERFGVK